MHEQLLHFRTVWVTFSEVAVERYDEFRLHRAYEV